MKKLILVLSIATFALSCQQAPTNFTINGTIDTEQPVEEVSIKVQGDTTALAKAKVVDGKFTLTGVMNEPKQAQVSVGYSMVQMVLENANYEAVVAKDYSYIKGGQMNDAIFGYKYNEDYLKASKDIEKGDLKAIKEAQKKWVPFQKRMSGIENDHKRGIIEGEATTLAKLYTLGILYDWDNYGYERKLELLKEYEEELGAHPYLVSYKKEMQEGMAHQEFLKSLEPGQPYKDFTATTIDGETLALGDVVAKNKYTLVEFWASWCGPCRGSFPHLKEVYSKYKDKGFEIYGLSLDEKEKAFLKASKEDQLPWINAVDYAAFKSKAAKDYGIQGIPFTVLIGNDGKIIGSGNDIRGLKLDTILEDLYAE